ncbi:AAA domain-containing protein [Runella sp. MFBS21]|uniref:AAA domain-containing protein n=1 Tax=Runella sp. MFBS21 TaxID=3034018 RepID=UPI0023F69287|nr:AAA domain-containing protein [Runella sp. MFBS21]MDF7822088.1 AAA domain-containing protein [Runella sp. MFBS21]
MTAEEIQELCVKASQTYYNYLDENELGRVVVEVYGKEIVKEDENIHKLRLAKKLFDLDAVVFIDKTSNKQYDTNQIKVIEYDIDGNYLIIKVPKESEFNIIALHHRDILIVSDLKFLVQRVIDWYKKNGTLVGLPITTESNNIPSSFFAEQPNEEQKQAIQNILISPFSYVWGAPGTGKTQLVLSYVIAQYIEQGDKVAILAPTNNAIEQVLRGVIRMTDKKGVDRKQIIRLGNPSKAFAEQYPEVCEAKGILKKISEIEKQIEIIQKVLESEAISKNYQKVKVAINAFSTVEAEIEKKNQIKVNIDSTKQKLSIAQNDLKIEKDKFQRELDILNLNYEKIKQDIEKLNFEQKSLEKSIASFFHSIKKVFSSANLTREENRLSEILTTLPSKQKELEKSNQTLRSKEFEIAKQIGILEQETQKIEVHYNNLLLEHKNESTFNQCFNTIKDSITFNTEIFNFLSDINLGNRSLKKKKVDEFAEQLHTELTIKNSIAQEYTKFSFAQLHKILSDFEQQKEFLKSQTTEERLKGVNIVACTLDCYIGRFADEELPVAHFFLDEAGYACAIKALTMFRSKKPVTFLGDHLQLPPVCELNDDKLTTKEEYKDVFIWSQSAIFIGDIFKKSKGEIFLDYLNNNEPTFSKVSKSDLKKTHRFGDNLAKVLNQFVYRNGFSSAQLNGTTKIKFIHVTNSIPPTNKRENHGEAQAIHDFIMSGKLNTKDFIVLTPYSNQVKLIGKLLPDLRKEHKISTVHGSQGREWKTVILSISDTSDMWFTNSQNKTSKGINLINTAVSRAKEELIIVCNHNFWINANGQLVQGLLKVGERLN